MTLTVLSLLKNGAVILLAVALYADPVTVHSVGGYTVATYGFVMYQEARAKASAAALSSQGNPGGLVTVSAAILTLITLTTSRAAWG